jgi:hypothetical protein
MNVIDLRIYPIMWKLLAVALIRPMCSDFGLMDAHWRRIGVVLFSRIGQQMQNKKTAYSGFLGVTALKRRRNQRFYWWVGRDSNSRSK